MYINTSPIMPNNCVSSTLVLLALSTTYFLSLAAHFFGNKINHYCCDMLALAAYLDEAVDRFRVAAQGFKDRLQHVDKDE